MRIFTYKKAIFIEGILQGLPPNESAKRAGYKYPRQTAYRLMQDEQIIFYLRKKGYAGELKAESKPHAKGFVDIKYIMQNEDNPLELLLFYMNCEEIHITQQVKIAAFLMPYFYARKPPKPSTAGT
ncbi:hypothetical protein [Acinetobacter sp. A1]|uniref:hypothetical protein n=1 Tax=Acinetobacter sp. A1 TaxID=401467 RepID=UPI0014474F86|nr:hypothetical protein [Acinetobacter sp. A1]